MTYYRCPACGMGFAGPKKQAICGACNRRRLADRRKWDAYAAMRKQEMERREQAKAQAAAEAERQRIDAIAAEDLRLWLLQDVH